MQPLVITSTTNPRVKSLLRLQEHKGRKETGLFIAEGTRAVSRALAAHLKIVEVWFCPALLKSAEAQSVRQELEALAGISWVDASPEVMGKVCYLEKPEGLIAICEPPAFTQESALDKWPVGKKDLLLVAVGTEKPGNLGAMIRSADAAGCALVIAAGAPVDALNPNAIRSSTGAVFSMPSFNLSEEDAIAYLLKTKTKILAAYPQGLENFSPMEYSKANYSGRVALVIGPEDKGLSQAWAKATKTSGGACVSIPMHDSVTDSLNASVAAGILIFEAARQRA